MMAARGDLDIEALPVLTRLADAGHRHEAEPIGGDHRDARRHKEAEAADAAQIEGAPR